MRTPDEIEALEIARIMTRDRAFYSPERDVIGMPPIEAFDGADLYAQTLNHASTPRRRRGASGETSPGGTVNMPITSKKSAPSLARPISVRIWVCRRVICTIMRPTSATGSR